MVKNYDDGWYQEQMDVHINEEGCIGKKDMRNIPSTDYSWLIDQGEQSISPYINTLDFLC